MCKHLLNIVLYLFIPIFMFGNNIDSLEQAAKQHFIENDKVAQLEAYTELGDIYAKRYDFDKGLSAYQAALKLAQELKKSELIFDLLNEIGRMHFWQDNYPQALEILQSAQQMKSSKITQQSKATNFSRIAEVFISLGMYEDALKHQQESLIISRQIDDQEGIGNSYRILSRIYWYLEQPKRAEKELMKALSIYKKLEDYKNIYTCYAALSSIYVETGDVEHALHYAKESLEIAEEIDYPYGKAFSTGLLGATYKRLGELDLAEIKLIIAIEEFQKLDIVFEAVDFQVIMAKLYHEREDYEAAISLLGKLDTIAEQISALQLKADVQEALATNYAALRNTDKAYEHQKVYTTLKDSLLGKEKHYQLSGLESKYKLKQLEREAEIKARDIQINREKGFLIVYSILLVLCFGLLISIYRRYKAVQNQQHSLSSSHSEIMRAYQKLNTNHNEMRRMAGLLSKEINDIVLSLEKRSTQGLQPGRADKLEVLEEENEAKKLSQLLVGMRLYRTIEGDQNRESLALSGVIPDAIEHLPQNLKQKAKRIRLQSLPVIFANRTQITQLFEYLIANAIKFNEMQYPEITITGEDRGIFDIITVQDKGIGIPLDKQKKVFELFYRASDDYEGSGAGLALARKIVEQHNGKIWLESEEGKGTTVFILLPKKIG